VLASLSSLSQEKPMFQRACLSIIRPPNPMACHPDPMACHPEPMTLATGGAPNDSRTDRTSKPEANAYGSGIG